MATILEFKLPKKSSESPLSKGAVISSTVNDVMLMIHHALYGEDEKDRPKNKMLAGQLLDELASHVKADNCYEHMVLSDISSEAVVSRYPEMLKQAEH